MNLKEIGELKHEFNKKDCWDNCTFYDIEEREGIKYICIIYKSTRVSKGKPYLSWMALDLRWDDAAMPLENFLEWDVCYQESKLLEKYEGKWEDMEDPEWAFTVANVVLDRVNGDERYGSRKLMLLGLDMDTPCGHYYDC